MTDLQKELFQLQDVAYKEFHRNLIPNVEQERVIGVRVPVLRKFAKQFSKSKASAAFLEDLPHFYYEENNLHMMLLIEMRDFSTCLEKMDAFLPYVDNWATCDLPLPQCFKTHKQELLPHYSGTERLSADASNRRHNFIRTRLPLNGACADSKENRNCLPGVNPAFSYFSIFCRAAVRYSS